MAWKYVKILGLALLFAFCIQTFIAAGFRISSNAMAETWKTGDYVLVNKLTFVIRKPQIGDAIIFRSPKDASEYLVGRITSKTQENFYLVGRSNREEFVIKSSDIVGRIFVSYYP